MNRDIKIVCPECLSNLDEGTESLVCVNCGKKFILKEQIPSFTELNPLFEGRFVTHLKPGRYEKSWFYPIIENMGIEHRRIAFLKKCFMELKSASLILDIGCGGGGWGLILKRYGTVVGLDVSLNSLKYARNIYKDVVHASVTQIPFPSDYFNALTSRDVLGHVPLYQKEKAFSEMYRVLKPGGIMVHAAIETDSKSLWFRFAKKYPELFTTYHIDKYGHIGLELPSVIIKRCQNIGFITRKVDKMHVLILYPSLFLKWFDNHYTSKSRAISFLGTISKAIHKSTSANLLTSLVLGMIEKITNPFLDIDHATGLLLCCQK